MPLFGTSRRVARRTARRTARRQQSMYGNDPYGGGGQEEYYDEPAPAQVDVTEQLQKLAKLHTEGVLTDEEFAAQKQKLLG
jgi:Short C-terminal domain